MTLIQIDPIGWLPDSFKQQIIDGVVTFVADQAENGIPPRARRTRKNRFSPAPVPGTCWACPESKTAF